LIESSVGTSMFVILVEADKALVYLSVRIVGSIINSIISDVKLVGLRHCVFVLCVLCGIEFTVLLE